LLGALVGVEKRLLDRGERLRGGADRGAIGIGAGGRVGQRAGRRDLIDRIEVRLRNGRFFVGLRLRRGGVGIDLRLSGSGLGYGRRSGRSLLADF